MASDSDDVEIVGAAGFDAARDAPHARPDCVVHKFTLTSHSAACPQCYCWVCDEPQRQCSKWTSFCAGDSCTNSSCNSHCHAVGNERRWVAARAEAKRAATSADVAQQRQQQRQPAADGGGGSGGARRQVPYQLNDGEAVQAQDEEVEDIFETYTPRHFPHGREHPDPIVETTSLAFVSPPAFADTSRLLPGVLPSVIAHRSLSSLQLEAVAYAGLRHGQTLGDGVTTAGFFLGDGPGVGKGRQLAATVLENWVTGGRRRHVWLSVSPDLEHDAKRDLVDLMQHIDMRPHGGDIPLYNLGKLSYRDITKEKGIIFATYAALVSKEGLNAAERDYNAAAAEGDEDAMAHAKSSGANASAKRTRLEQLVKWMAADPAAAKAGGGGGGDGCVLFDECHKAKNLLPSKGGGGASQTAKAVLELQERLPKARVIYCSATGVSSVRNMVRAPMCLCMCSTCSP